MLIDSHCHLDAAEFDADRQTVLGAAFAAGVGMIVVPAVHRSTFEPVLNLTRQYPQCVCALGIHPMYVERSSMEDIGALEPLLQDPHVVAVGEIGLDFFVEGYDRTLQEAFFIEQLKLAKAHDLPVILHVRRSIDIILKYLRIHRVRGGIAHAFNGSEQQAQEFIRLGFKLGFGGAMTYPRATRLRKLAAVLPLESIVLETDAPDIPPEWLGHGGRNSPEHLPQIAQVLAELRGAEISQIIDTTGRNVLQALPRLGNLCTPAHKSH
ncbi:MAG TPA: TatD family hydrolase [Methylophilaceae bacterium]|jgi:TatD DNase family protein